jgi:hypothetical protein
MVLFVSYGIWKLLCDDDQALTDPWFKDEPLRVSKRPLC